VFTWCVVLWLFFEVYFSRLWIFLHLNSFVWRLTCVNVGILLFKLLLCWFLNYVVLKLQTCKASRVSLEPVVMTAIAVRLTCRFWNDFYWKLYICGCVPQALRSKYKWPVLAVILGHSGWLWIVLIIRQRRHQVCIKLLFSLLFWRDWLLSIVLNGIGW